MADVASCGKWACFCGKSGALLRSLALENWTWVKNGSTCGGAREENLLWLAALGVGCVPLCLVCACVRVGVCVARGLCSPHRGCFCAFVQRLAGVCVCVCGWVGMCVGGLRVCSPYCVRECCMLFRGFCVAFPSLVIMKRYHRVRSRCAASHASVCQHPSRPFKPLRSHGSGQGAAAALFHPFFVSNFPQTLTNWRLTQRITSSELTTTPISNKNDE